MGAPPAATHHHPVRVYFEDTDAGGIVYHARYLHFAERARTEMLREAGLSHATMLAETGIAFAVRRCLIDYAAPARLDDSLDVATRITHIGGASIGLEQRVMRGDTLLVRLELTLAAVDRRGRAVRLPAEARRVLGAMER